MQADEEELAASFLPRASAIARRHAAAYPFLRDELESAANEALLWAIRHLADPGRTITSDLGWVLGVIHNRCRNAVSHALRRRRWERPADDVVWMNLADKRTASVEMELVLGPDFRALIAGLPARLRGVATAQLLDGERLEDFAARSGITGCTARCYWNEAKAILASRLTR
jgi:DNA-directed RNA polymerase specialized sigma24 family protein